MNRTLLVTTVMVAAALAIGVYATSVQAAFAGHGGVHLSQSTASITTVPR